MFGGAIGRAQWESEQARQRSRDAELHVFLRLDHVAELLHQVDAAHEVDLEDLLVDAEVGVQGLLALRDARVEYEEVDAEAVGDHVVVEAVDGAVVVKLGLGGVGAHAILLALLLGPVEVVDTEARQHEMAAFLRQVQRDALPDARAAASD